jgi:hypothetical protein
MMFPLQNGHLEKYNNQGFRKGNPVTFVNKFYKMEKNDKDKPGEAPHTEGDVKQSKSDPQLTELDGLKKGGVEPNVHQADKPKDKKGRTED